MQPSRSILKIPVLLIFIFLISGFVAYRSGALDELFSRKKELINPPFPEAKGLNVVNTSNTSLSDVLPDSLPDLRFVTISSSKSGMVIEPAYKLPDSLLFKLILRNSELRTQRSIIMSSSKSAIIIEPKSEPRWLYIIDTTTKKQ